MLGRIPTGSAFAALPLATVLTAAAQGWWWLVWLAGAVLAAALVWMFAPWIPRLRDVLPSRKRVDYLEVAWAEGQRLVVRQIPSMADLDVWKRDVSAWEVTVQEWTTENIGGVEGMQFFQPHYSAYSHALGHTLNTDHGQACNRIVHQLAELIRLRDDEERKLH